MASSQKILPIAATIMLFIVAGRAITSGKLLQPRCLEALPDLMYRGGSLPA
jgi:hypothetical protein